MEKPLLPSPEIGERLGVVTNIKPVKYVNGNQGGKDARQYDGQLAHIELLDRPKAAEILRNPGYRNQLETNGRVHFSSGEYTRYAQNHPLTKLSRDPQALEHIPDHFVPYSLFIPGPLPAPAHFSARKKLLVSDPGPGLRLNDVLSERFMAFGLDYEIPFVETQALRFGIIARELKGTMSVLDKNGTKARDFTPTALEHGYTYPDGYLVGEEKYDAHAKPFLAAQSQANGTLRDYHQKIATASGPLNGAARDEYYRSLPLYRVLIFKPDADKPWNYFFTLTAENASEWDLLQPVHPGGQPIRIFISGEKKARDGFTPATCEYYFSDSRIHRFGTYLPPHHRFEDHQKDRNGTDRIIGGFVRPEFRAGL